MSATHFYSPELFSDPTEQFDESKRLRALDDYAIYGTAPELKFDEIVQTAAQICNVSKSMINFIGSEKTWVKARYGFDIQTTCREGSLCSDALHHKEMLLIEDAQNDPRFSNNPNVACENGVKFYIGFPLRTPDGLPVGVFCLFDSEKKFLSVKQIQLLKLMAKQICTLMELDKSVVRLQQFAENLNQLNQSKDRFFSIIAHDLRAAFHGILAFSDVLDTEYDDLDPDNIKQIANYLNLSSQATYKLLENLLSWAQVESGSMRFKPERLDLERLIDSSVTALSLTATQKNIHLHFNSMHQLSVMGDVNMLQSLLHNLISNAIKFTHSGGSVNVNSTIHNGEIQITIQDSGTGMTHEQLSQLFALEHSRSNKGTAGEKGTGLGLLLCKQFIDQHGGRIMVQSELGQGSCFTVYLPMANKLS